MKVVILGAAGFIGTNLAIKLAKNPENQITLVDTNREYFKPIESYGFRNINIIEDSLREDMNFEKVISEQDIVYHLVSTVIPSTANQNIGLDIESNLSFSTKLFDSCVLNKVKKIVFISSGGTVYGKESNCPLNEDTPTNPISSYGLQKVMIEKLLYLYNYKYNLDYEVVRLANPYGPYQRPNGVLGAVTTFIYKALNGEEITVYGDGSVVRDFIYIDDVINAILKITNNNSSHHIFNVGSGTGISIMQLINEIESVLNIKLNIVFKEGRAVDVPMNYLDIRRYENSFGKLCSTTLQQGILETADFMKKEYNITESKGMKLK